MVRETYQHWYGGPGSKRRKHVVSRWYGTDRVRHIRGVRYNADHKICKDKTQAKRLADNWREAGRDARIFKLKEGWRVFVSTRKRKKLRKK